ncbi:MAG: hypothetical protein ACKV2T_20270 [Kofleriaceae bacterium]
MTDAPEPKRTSPWRRVLPWLVGIAIVVVLALRVPAAAFQRALAEGPHVELALVDLGVTIAMLLTDTLATWAALSVVGVRWDIAKVFAVRGATYVLSLINYAVGQGGIGYYLHRSGVPGKRAIGVTLFMIGTTFATLLLLNAVTWLVDHEGIDPRALWTVYGLTGAFVVYLVVILARPTALANNQVLAPLFDARLPGYALAILARLPHVIVIVFGHWIAMRAWGIPAPLALAASVLPGLAFAAALPISPAGLGTTQAGLVLFFSAFAAGATQEAREANLLAFSIVHFVYGMIGQLAVGILCVPLARRQDAASRDGA